MLVQLVSFSFTAVYSQDIHAAQNAATIYGDITLKSDANLANPGIRFSDNSYQTTASPWIYSGLDIYVYRKIGIGSLPSNDATLFVLNNSDAGPAAQFQTSSSANYLPAVSSFSPGSGQAFYGLNTGNGHAGYFHISNPSSGSSALVAETNGTGYAGEFIGTLKVTGAVTFSDTSAQSAAKTDCMGRFEDNGDGTVTDCRSGLVWLKNASCNETSGGIIKSTGYLSWNDAVAWTSGLGHNMCGLSDGSYAGDWRLPTKTELMALVESARKQGFDHPVLTNQAGTAKWTPGNPFNGVINDVYWSNSTFAGNTLQAWGVSLSYGYSYIISKSYTGATNEFVWPVRSRQ